jgi:hypothetical protein
MNKIKKDSNKFKELFRQAGKFGKLVAEEDSRLNTYYVGREKYLDKALDYDNPINFFVGPKGVGKSAILQMVRIENASNQKRIINITPDDLAFSALANIQATNPLLSDATKQQWLFKSLWDYVLLMELWARETPSSQRFAWFKKMWPNKDEKRLQRLFNVSFDKNGEPKDNSFTDRIIQMIDEVEYHYEEIGGKIKLRETEKDKYVFLSEINHAVKIMPNLLTNEYFILIDDLDLYWKNEPSQNALIASLFLTIRKLSSNRIKILVSIREDIFAQLPIQDKDKMRDKICNITWDHDSLKEMIKKRIVSIIGHCKDEDIWGDLFPVNAFEVTAQHSSLKPREIVRLSYLCLEVALKNSHKRIQESDMSEALLNYSKERIADLDSEYHYKYPSLRYVIDKFYGKVKEFKLGAVKDIATELEVERMEKGNKQPYDWAGYFDSCPEQLAIILLEIGFLQIKVNRTAKPEDYSHSKHSTIDKDTWLAIHPMYNNGLALLGS